ncbi:antibiotic biosynthesis monooxygenase family protein [Croceiramulus getboli]|nr:antibiotic biosynthesis monooxygenase [Flavobacteriaceae bacterium YJPT1-3]
MNTSRTLPYYAVIFTSKQRPDIEGYEEMARRMEYLARRQPGFLGMDHARSELGITISYWETEADILRWKAEEEHQKAQQLGRELWYESYELRICKVEREYGFKHPN